MKNLFLVLVTFLFAAPAMAEVFSTDTYGAWTLQALSGDNTVPVCVISTIGSDGKKIQVNLYPLGNGEQDVTMTIHDLGWDFSGYASDSKFTVRFDFVSAKYGADSLKGTGQIKDNSTLIFRGMTKSFSTDFVSYSTLTLFAGTANEVVVNLLGTKALAQGLDSCIETVLNEQ